MVHFFASHKTFVVIVLGVVLALGALWWSVSESGSPEPLVTGQGPNAAPGSQEIVTTLLQLRTVSLSGTIFSDPSFASLRDFGTQIMSEPIGRPNPFAPLFSRTATPAASVSTTTPTSTLPRIPRAR